jgi:hypothetical protein
MNNMAKSAKALSQVVSLLLGEDFVRPIEKVMVDYPFAVYVY